MDCSLILVLFLCVCLIIFTALKERGIRLNVAEISDDEIEFSLDIDKSPVVVYSKSRDMLSVYNTGGKQTIPLIVGKENLRLLYGALDYINRKKEI